MKLLQESQFFLLAFLLLLLHVATGEKDPVSFEESAYEMPPTGQTIPQETLDLISTSNRFYHSKYRTLCQPSQIHLSLGDRSKDINPSSTGMHLSFSIPNRITQECHPDQIQIEVQYGLVQSDVYSSFLIHENDENVHIKQYSYTSPFAMMETYDSDFQYHVAIHDLDFDSNYWYDFNVLKLSGKQLDSSSSIMVPQTKRYLRSVHQNKAKKIFRTAPKPGSTKPVKFAIVGDLGQTYNSTTTMLNMLSTLQDEDPPTALLIAGDMSYANTIQQEWDNWFNLMEPITQKIPMMVAAGNHEIECDAKGNHLPFTAYENRFWMPNRLGDAVLKPVEESKSDYVKVWTACATPSVFEGQYDFGNAFYSFEYGMVKTIVLSSYSQTHKRSEQYKWLKSELIKVNQDRKRTPWLVVMMHTQFYTTFKAHNDEKQTIDMKDSMEELFLHYKVNIVISGHDHAYMRTFGMYNGLRVKDGCAPVYLIVGEGGNREEHVKSYLNPQKEDWVAIRDRSVYGFGTLEVSNSTAARWTWNMGGKSVGFRDDVWLQNQYHL